ncbi:hypothetical protein LSAT2_010257 [Lamellibrachia satsuma]|nr:hypothetical protein LSAT2_010257 [Lamellibrachia satsuma]
MISYQWDNQQLMRRIGDKLIEAGFKVWMDVYDMSGSTLQAMSAAVEEASMVLIAASTKYKDSTSCRTEGEYAYNKRREIVPLIVEPGYTPDGWLGPLVLNHLYFDFTDDTNFEQKMKELINEIQRRGQCMIQCNEGACTRKKIGSSADTTHSARGTASNSWAYSLCCCWPCHRRVLPEEQERKVGEPMRTIYVSGCFPMVDIKF